MDLLVLYQFWANGIGKRKFLLQVSETKEDENPEPIVHIDEHSDPDATIVEMCFGDRLGALLDTVCLTLWAIM